MIEMTNKEKIEKIKKFQACDHVHELTCAHCSHEPLVPEEKGDEIIVFCAKCGYIQKDIPEAVFKVSDEFLTSDPAAILKRMSEEGE